MVNQATNGSRASSRKTTTKKESSSLNVHQRIHQVMQDVSYVQKESVSAVPYSVVSHDAVTAKLRPAVLKARLVYYVVDQKVHQDGNRTEITLTLRIVNIDKPDDFIDVKSAGYGCDKQDKGPGKAISYAVKYALLKGFGLETGDDADFDNIPHQSASSVREVESSDEGPSPREAFAAAVMSWSGIHVGQTADYVAASKDIAKFFGVTLNKQTHAEDLARMAAVIDKHIQDGDDWIRTISGGKTP